MPATVVNLTPSNSQKLSQLSRQTGRSPDELLNEAVERLEPAVAPSLPDWKAAWRQAAGMWQDHGQLDETLRQLRSELNRVEPPGEAL